MTAFIHPFIGKLFFRFTVVIHTSCCRVHLLGYKVSCRWKKNFMISDLIIFSPSQDCLSVLLRYESLFSFFYSFSFKSQSHLMTVCDGLSE